jgi:hypothetical protein
MLAPELWKIRVCHLSTVDSAPRRQSARTRTALTDPNEKGVSRGYCAKSACSIAAFCIPLRHLLRPFLIGSLIGCRNDPSTWTLAALDTAKLFSSIRRRVISVPEIVRMIAKGDSMTLPVALIRVATSPTIARPSLARMSCTSNLTGSVMPRRPRMKPATALRPAPVPIHGSAPASRGAIYPNAVSGPRGIRPRWRQPVNFDGGERYRVRQRRAQGVKTANP